MPDHATLPRHVRARNKAALRALLATPIKAYEIPAGESRDLFINRELTERFEALFAFYDIPADFPVPTQWEQLARHLADMYVRGCQVLLKGPGGPSEERREKQRDLFRKFKGYEAQSRLKGSDARHLFWIKYRKECAEAGFMKERSFAQALAKFEKLWIRLPLALRQTQK